MIKAHIIFHKFDTDNIMIIAQKTRLDEEERKEQGKEEQGKRRSVHQHHSQCQCLPMYTNNTDTQEQGRKPHHIPQPTSNKSII